MGFRRTQQELADIYRRSTYLPICRRQEVTELGILRKDSDEGKAAGIREDMCIFEDPHPEKEDERYLSTQQRLVRFDIEIHENDALRAIRERERKRREDMIQEEIDRRKFPHWFDENGYRRPDAEVWAIINAEVAEKIKNGTV